MVEFLRTNFDPSAVTRLEQQNLAVRLDRAVAIAVALGVPLVSLLTDDVVHENRRLIREHLAELAVAQREWERTRQKVHQITLTIQMFSADTGKAEN